MKTYIIAEIGPNHNGKVEKALLMREKRAVIGVDAVKFQLTIKLKFFCIYLPQGYLHVFAYLG